MIEFIQPYVGITLKLVTGMIGILAFYVLQEKPRWHNLHHLIL